MYNNIQGSNKVMGRVLFIPYFFLFGTPVVVTIIIHYIEMYEF